MSPVSRIEHTRCERVGDTARVCDTLPAFPPPARQARRLQPPCPGPQAPVPRLEHCTASCGFEDPRVLGTCPQGSDLAGPGWPHAVCVVEAPSDCCAARAEGRSAPSALVTERFTCGAKRRFHSPSDGAGLWGPLTKKASVSPPRETTARRGSRGQRGHPRVASEGQVAVPRRGRNRGAVGAARPTPHPLASRPPSLALPARCHPGPSSVLSAKCAVRSVPCSARSSGGKAHGNLNKQMKSSREAPA